MKSNNLPEQPMSQAPSSTSSTEQSSLSSLSPIAIIGVSSVFPEAPDARAFWELIRSGKDAIGEIPATHWSPDDYFDADPKRPDFTYCKRGGFLPSMSFDPTEFGIPPNALEATDTSQLLSLMVAKALMHDAGYGEEGSFDKQRVGVILGVTGTQELVISLGARLGHPIWRKALEQSGIPAAKVEEVVQAISDGYVGWQENSFPGLLGNVVAGRIASRLDFGGTNCVVDAACASSLSAMHLSILELASGRADMMVTGGVDALNDIFMYMCFSKTPALSPTGDARPFSEDADGTVLGEGVGMVLLKRLDDAERDGDTIYAVIRGLGTSSDGRSRSIYAPRSEGQQQALLRAYKEAGVSPRELQLVEAHGTGTKVGDATEFAALRQVFSESSDEASWCALGSVKAQIGHTKSAAGAASVIKTALALHHKVLPPTIKISAPNPKLGIEGSPFYLNTVPRPWIKERGARKAGVSSFGFGGSNFHLVLEEAAATKTAIDWTGAPLLLCLSGPEVTDLTRQLDVWQQTLTQAQWDLGDWLREAARSRKAFEPQAPHRLVINAISLGALSKLLVQASEHLQVEAPKELFSTALSYGGPGCLREAGQVAVLFPGQGSQYPYMGRDLCCAFPEAFAVFEEAETHFAGEGSLASRVFPSTLFAPDEAKQQKLALADTSVAQPALGAIGLGMWRVLQSYGVPVDMVGGHSYGELLALCAAGRTSSDALHQMSNRRGQLMAQGDTDRGTMMAVSAPLDAIDALLEEHGLDLVLANRNTPTQGVLSGSKAAITMAQGLCQERGWRSTILPVSAAFHSPLVEDARQPFATHLAGLAWHQGQLPVYANATGALYPEDASTTQERLAEQLTSPVHFVSQIEAMYQQGARVFLEVGPNVVLTGLVRSILGERPHQVIALDASRGRHHGLYDLAGCLGQLASLGFPIDLVQWSPAPPQPHKQRMSIAINGANIRTTQPKPRPVASTSAPQSPVVAPALPNNPMQTKPPTPTYAAQSAKAARASVDVGHQITTSASQPSVFGSGSTQRNEPPIMTHKSSNGGNQPLQGQAAGIAPSANQAHQASMTAQMPQVAHMSHDPHRTHFAQHALQLMQEGIRSMQSLQQETSASHQRFLDGQQQAQYALREMLQQSQRLFDAGLGLPASSLQTMSAAPVAAMAPMAPMAPLSQPMQPMQQVQQVQAMQPQQPVQAQWAGPWSTATAAPAPQWMPQPVAPSMANAAPANWQAPAATPQAMPSIQAPMTPPVPQMMQQPMQPQMGQGPEPSGAQYPHTASLQQPAPKAIPHAANTRPVAAPMASTASTSAASLAPEGPVSTAGLTDVMLQVVSDLTGYPQDMLSLDMDMEADLGIDSIKRVEILSAVTEKLPQFSSGQTDHLGSLRTLQQIVDALFAEQADAQGTNGTEGGKSAPVPFDHAGPEASPVERRILSLQSYPESQESALSLSKNHPIWVTDDGTALSQQVVAALQAEGFVVELLPALTAASDVWADYASPTDTTPLTGVVLIAPPIPGQALWDAAEESMLGRGFWVAHHAVDRLAQAATKGGAFFVSVTRMDGGFGLLAPAQMAPLQGGLAGLTKTLAREVPAISCRALDLDPAWEDQKTLARAIAARALSSGPMEVGLAWDGQDSAGGCGELMRTLELHQDTPGEGAVALQPGEVVVVTGGARGVTAAVACALAEAYRPTLYLLGRSSMPEDEPDWLVPLREEAAIKKGLLQQLAQRPSPKELEQAYQKVRQAREIRETLQRISELGVKVFYRSVDVRAAGPVAALLEQIREASGPIRMLVHAAGVIDDRRIVDKSMSSFQKVFGTKVEGLRQLLAGTADDPLHTIALFSSVSARTGNVGQVDYAMANEVLNKVARQQAALRPDCRVLSLNWGPWDGGMVTPGLKRMFTAQGVQLIGLKAGAQAMLAALGDHASSAVEIILGSVFEDATSEETQEAPESPALPDELVDADETEALTMLLSQSISLENHPVLASHQLGRRPVVPVALSLEWLAHGALHGHPGLQLFGIEQLRVLRGIRVDTDATEVQLWTGPAQKVKGRYKVPLELRGAIDGDRQPLWVRATAILGVMPSTPPEFAPPEGLVAQAYPLAIEDAYKTVLFHGAALHGIAYIEGHSKSGMRALLKPAPKPKEWIQTPLRRKWLLEPLILDSAFQMAILWCHAHCGMQSLPVFLGELQVFRPFPATLIGCDLVVRDVSAHKLTADFCFFDEQGDVIAVLDGYECTMDASLARAFHPESLPEHTDASVQEQPSV